MQALGFGQRTRAYHLHLENSTFTQKGERLLPRKTEPQKREVESGYFLSCLCTFVVKYGNQQISRQFGSENIKTCER